MRANVRRKCLPRRGRVSAAGRCYRRLRVHVQHVVIGRGVRPRWWGMVPGAAGTFISSSDLSTTFTTAASTAAASATAHGALPAPRSVR